MEIKLAINYFTVHLKLFFVTFKTMKIKLHILFNILVILCILFSYVLFNFYGLGKPSKFLFHARLRNDVSVCNIFKRIWHFELLSVYGKLRSLTLYFITSFVAVVGFLIQTSNKPCRLFLFFPRALEDILIQT